MKRNMDLTDQQWRKSSYSTTETECVEALWRKSSRSTTEGECVEIARWVGSPEVGVRDSKNPGGGHLVVPARAWLALTGTLPDSRFGR
ncbi:DUF397 domain-containing protein [Actinokineospora sp.]|uniref:DUF397 domain-containing protein n=1 Tax=Actinokineospora sp. TaxID=1872133 RepID=UPI0040379EEC